ncbi:MAG: hypothetical protein K2Z81_28155, partial [Cyanobacteria bacterium]|nr:hypothetical protein [Cyanobacteriota bacterium]
ESGRDLTGMQSNLSTGRSASSLREPEISRLPSARDVSSYHYYPESHRMFIWIKLTALCLLLVYTLVKGGDWTEVFDNEARYKNNFEFHGFFTFLCLGITGLALFVFISAAGGGGTSAQDSRANTQNVRNKSVSRSINRARKSAAKKRKRLNMSAKKVGARKVGT